jgi:DNA-3-methyladenine glycosylase I
MRCKWCESSPLMMRYHDEEWGVPDHDDRKLFELLILDCFQAGLSWSTILNKRENFRAALDNFNFAIIAQYDALKIETLLANPGIIRNRQKIIATIRNAQGVLSIRKEFGSLDRYLWGFTGGKPVLNAWQVESQVPATSPEGDALSRDLRQRGFGFVGPTIVYAFMQSAGLVNDHVVDCFRYYLCKE